MEIKIFWMFVATAVVLGYELLRRFSLHLTRRIFKRQSKYLKTLQEASNGMAAIENLQHLLGLVTHFMTRYLGTRQASILTCRKSEAGYWLACQRGFAKRYLEYWIPEDHPLIACLKKDEEYLDRKKLGKLRKGKWGSLKTSKREPGDIKKIVKFFDDFGAFCVIPSFLGKDLKNLLVLGPRKSLLPYSQDELEFVFRLAQESAVAIENARLFEETNKKKDDLKAVNDQLEYSKSRLMKALRETERANKQLQDTQAQLIHEQKMATLGRLAASVGHEVNNPLTILSMNVSRAMLKFRKDPEIRVSEIADLFPKMEQNVSRIKAVVNTLTGLLKKSEKGKFEALSVRSILEETLPLVQFQTYLENLTGTQVEFFIPDNLPLIRGDLERLQEVFLNLFINAYQAMNGKRTRRIKITAATDPADSSKVLIHFSDNGCGMKEEVQKRIFHYGYTTKAPGKGSGMGLYMCKYIMELHGGSICVKSTPAVGSTFIVGLPCDQQRLPADYPGVPASPEILTGIAF